MKYKKKLAYKYKYKHSSDTDQVVTDSIKSVSVSSYYRIYRIEFGSQEGLDGQFWIITKPARNGNENWFERKLAITNCKNWEQICSCFELDICSIAKLILEVGHYQL